MARGVNKVILIGNLGSDPEVRNLPNGNAVANITLATTDSWKDKQTGQKQERTEWHRVVFFGRLAEVVGQYASKGSKMYIEGRLQTREWEKDGIKRYTTEIVVDIGGQMQLLDSRPQESTQGTSKPAAPRQAPAGAGATAQQYQQARQGAAPRQQQNSPQAAPQPAQDQPEFNDLDDDIPFAWLGLQEGRNFLWMI